MFSNPIYYIALIIVLIILVIILCKVIADHKHDNAVLKEYQEKMNRIRQERWNAALKKRKEEDKNRTYYTTYNERE